MRLIFAAVIFSTVCCLALVTNRARADPDQTMRSADEVLHEIMAIPARSIPAALLAEAQGVAIVPDVIKIGFVAGIRRGHGVVLVRGADGGWSLPQFVTLTGGSVGWQAGVQGTDVVLVFMTPKSVDGLLRGKFTIGADASVAAGPVGRNAAAATDARLRAEILSYSRSRGLFVGLALDGTAIEIDAAAQSAYYGAPPAAAPARVPESATKLLEDLLVLTQAGKASAGLPVPPPQAVATNPPTPRQSLGRSASRLYAIVDERWRNYLTLPKEVFEGNEEAQLDSLRAALAQYDKVAGNPSYRTLTERSEFQSTHKLLREYARELSGVSGPRLALPPPPPKR